MATINSTQNENQCSWLKFVHQVHEPVTGIMEIEEYTGDCFADGTPKGVKYFLNTDKYGKLADFLPFMYDQETDSYNVFQIGSSALNAVKAGKPVTIEYNYVTRNGKEQHFIRSITPA